MVCIHGGGDSSPGGPGGAAGEPHGRERLKSRRRGYDFTLSAFADTSDAIVSQRGLTEVRLHPRHSPVPDLSAQADIAGSQPRFQSPWTGAGRGSGARLRTTAGLPPERLKSPQRLRKASQTA